jgi:DNA-binding Xre family transcriptional regulator
MTKLQQLLIEKKMLQSDLIRTIKEKHNIDFDKANLSRIVCGVKTNYTLETARVIATSLDVTVDEIIE